jgi:hypothetical protein
MNKALEYKNEKAYLYHLKRNPHIDDGELHNLLHNIILFNWIETFQYLIELYPMSKYYYIYYFKYLNKLDKHSFRKIILQKWDSVFPRKLDLASITEEQFSTLIVEIWKALPFSNLSVNEKRNTRLTIPDLLDISNEYSKNNCINKLNGKFFYNITREKDFDPIWIDNDIGYMDYVADILENIKSHNDIPKSKL